MAGSQSTNHKWTFFRAGGFDQVKLQSGADLMNLDELDQKLWVALACPTSGLEIDARTLALIDTDKDGRVRARELIAAVKFACENLKNPDDLLKGDADAAAGGHQRRARPRARRCWRRRGRSWPTSASPTRPRSASRTSPIRRACSPTRAFNGDGVITETVAERRRHARADPRDRRHASAACRIGRASRASTRRRMDAFFAEARAYDAWFAEAEADAAARAAARRRRARPPRPPAIAAVAAKVDDYFGRCRLAAFDPRALPALNRSRGGVPGASPPSDLTLTADEVAGFPLAQVGARTGRCRWRAGQPGARRRAGDARARRRRAAAGPARPR